MNEVASFIKANEDQAHCNLSIGNPARITDVSSMWKRLVLESVEENFQTASCQYGLSRGEQSAVDAIKDCFNQLYHWNITSDHVVVGPGSQLLVFVMACLFAGKSDGRVKNIVVPMEPEYTGYMGLSVGEGRILGVAPGIEKLPHRRFRYRVNHEGMKLLEDVGLFLISNPMNPTGHSYTTAELNELAETAAAYNCPLVVDNAYGKPFPRVASSQSDPVYHPNIINCFSISKAGMPGERIGFMVGEPDTINAITSCLSNITLHAPQVHQVALARALNSGLLEHHAVQTIKPYYLQKRRYAENLLLKNTPSDVPLRLYQSEGGMFCWVWIDHREFNGLHFYRQLKSKYTYIMPGEFFVTPGSELTEHARQCFRLSLSADYDELEAGLNSICRELRAYRSTTDVLSG